MMFSQRRWGRERRNHDGRGVWRSQDRAAVRRSLAGLPTGRPSRAFRGPVSGICPAAGGKTAKRRCSACGGNAGRVRRGDRRTPGCLAPALRRHFTGSPPTWFMAGEIAPAQIAAIRFGDEGQRWRMMPVAQFVSIRRASSICAAGWQGIGGGAVDDGISARRQLIDLRRLQDAQAVSRRATASIASPIRSVLLTCAGNSRNAPSHSGLNSR